MTLSTVFTRLMLSLTLALSFSVKASFDIMAYNVENLFDTEHDDGKNDYEYLPKSNPLKAKGCRETSSAYRLKGCLSTDWTPLRLELKLNQIRRLVYEGVGHLPAIMALEEVENDNVVSKLAQKLGYDGHVTANGPDERGIDVAVMYDSKQNIVLKSFKEHVLKDVIFEQNPTRNILEVHFQTPEGDLILFVNHWPSQSNPVVNRMKAAEAVRELMEKRREEFKDALIVATGDFNTIDTDLPHPFKDELLSKHDITDIFMNNNKENTHPDYQNIPKPTGTYYYKKTKEWNFLDRFFVAKSEKGNGLNIRHGSPKIVSPFFAMKIYIPNRSRTNSEMVGTPWSYNHNADNAELAGFSDHFPIIMTLE